MAQGQNWTTRRASNRGFASMGPPSSARSPAGRQSPAKPASARTANWLAQAGRKGGEPAGRIAPQARLTDAASIRQQRKGARFHSARADSRAEPDV